MNYTIDQILMALNKHKVRATYSAVGSVLGCTSESVATRYLRDRRPEASWVVNSESMEPIGYKSDDVHPDLMLHSMIIRHPDTLVALLKK